MSTSNKKSDSQIVDHKSFITRYCREKALPLDYGRSSLEKECTRIATEAREEFKALKNASNTNGCSDSGDNSHANSPTNENDDGTGSTSGNKQNGTATSTENLSGRCDLSPAQKYSIRLKNNRKSACASKVFTEIYKLAMADRLRKVDQYIGRNKLVECNITSKDIRSIYHSTDGSTVKNISVRSESTSLQDIKLHSEDFKQQKFNTNRQTSAESNNQADDAKELRQQQVDEFQNRIKCLDAELQNLSELNSFGRSQITALKQKNNDLNQRINLLNIENSELLGKLKVQQHEREQVVVTADRQLDKNQYALNKSKQTAEKKLNEALKPEINSSLAKIQVIDANDAQPAPQVLTQVPSAPRSTERKRLHGTEVPIGNLPGDRDQSGDPNQLTYSPRKRQKLNSTNTESKDDIVPSYCLPETQSQCDDTDKSTEPKSTTAAPLSDILAPVVISEPDCDQSLPNSQRDPVIDGEGNSQPVRVPTPKSRSHFQRTCGLDSPSHSQPLSQSDGILVRSSPCIPTPSKTPGVHQEGKISFSQTPSEQGLMESRALDHYNPMDSSDPTSRSGAGSAHSGFPCVLSQPDPGSQPDYEAFKSSLGSEDLTLTNEPERFFNSSQGHAAKHPKPQIANPSSSNSIPRNGVLSPPISTQ